MSDDDRPSISDLQREIPRWPTNWKPVLGNDFARLVALSRNAMPVLIEIAVAALEWRGDGPRTDDDARDACVRLLAALTKVRP